MASKRWVFLAVCLLWAAFAVMVIEMGWHGYYVAAGFVLAILGVWSAPTRAGSS